MRSMSTKHTWDFKPRLRTNAFGWKGSSLACQRLKEAVTEIKRMAKTDPVMAGDGVVSLVERIWPAFQSIDTSSGALGGAVHWAQKELLPIAIEAPADRKTRDKWLDRLWQAILDDGITYLWPVQKRWGELCGSPEVASQWADQLLSELRTAWSDSGRRTSVREATICLSSLFAAGRHEELMDLLALDRHAFWDYRQFGVRLLLKQGRTEDALAYAEASRRLSQSDLAIDAVCEEILLEAGRADEAYEKYALSANSSSTGLATFRAIVRKYPGIEPKKILLDLANASGEPGRWFASAKDAGLLELALEFANTGRTDPRTLTRAARDLLEKDASFSFKVGRLAIERILSGYGYELTGRDVLEAYLHFMAAAQKLGVVSEARADIGAMLMKMSGGQFAEILMRQSGLQPPPKPSKALVRKKRA